MLMKYTVSLNLSNTKTSSFDDINLVMLKKVIQILCHPLALIINKSFETGKVPDELKIAKILFPKLGPTDDINNWHPISILSVFSKIVEKLMLIRVLKFCNQLGL